MGLISDRHQFTQENVNLSPQSPGVYILFDDGEIIYIGSGTLTIRERLQRHHNGLEGSCTQAATHYEREVVSNPRTRETQLIDAFVEKYGVLPRCNDVRPG